MFAIVGLATIVVDLQAQMETRSDPADIAVLGDSFHAFTQQVHRFVSWARVYFYAYISIAVVVLMNLVTAIIVENAMETSKSDHEHVASEEEAKITKEIRGLRKLFRSLGTDDSGTISWDDFKDSFDDPEMSRHWKVLDFAQEDCVELFRLPDGGGEVTTNKFLEAWSRRSGTAQSKDVFKVQKTQEKLQNHVDVVVARPHTPY